jgi:hypothetical protein
MLGFPPRLLWLLVEGEWNVMPYVGHFKRLCFGIDARLSRLKNRFNMTDETGWQTNNNPTKSTDSRIRKIVNLSLYLTSKYPQSNVCWSKRHEA